MDIALNTRKANVLFNPGAEINRIAETHYFIRLELRKALDGFVLSDYAKSVLGGNATYLEYWEKSFSDRFFDMGTLIRLGTSIENCLKYFYMDQKGYGNIAQLKNSCEYSKGIFQRIQAWQQNGVIALYQRELGVDLTQNPHLVEIQELMLHRHLYAHCSGIVDDDYIYDILRTTGQDLQQLPELSSYPNQETYFFEPLKRLNDFIEATRGFFAKF